MIIQTCNWCLPSKNLKTTLETDFASYVKVHFSTYKFTMLWKEKTENQLLNLSYIKKSFILISLIFIFLILNPLHEPISKCIINLDQLPPT